MDEIQEIFLFTYIDNRFDGRSLLELKPGTPWSLNLRLLGSLYSTRACIFQLNSNSSFCYKDIREKLCFTAFSAVLCVVFV